MNAAEQSEGDSAELRSVSHTLEEAARRITAIAAHYGDGRHEDVQAQLLDAERSLRTAVRRLENAVARLG